MNQSPKYKVRQTVIYTKQNVYAFELNKKYRIIQTLFTAGGWYYLLYNKEGIIHTHYTGNNPGYWAEEGYLKYIPLYEQLLLFDLV